MTRLILDLAGSRWTPEAVTRQIEAYRQAWDEHTSALANRDWRKQGYTLKDMEIIADELIEDAVMRGSWRVEAVMPMAPEAEGRER